MNCSAILHSVALAIEEDVGAGDITGNLLPNKAAIAKIITREESVICGCDWVNEVYRQLDDSININWLVEDGAWVQPNQVLCSLQGPCRSLLKGERVSLNFLQTLSGTATITHHYAKALLGTSTVLLDTRKTLPGLRYAQKYAVRCGGGKNHRAGLFDAFLIKENHIMASGSIGHAVTLARAQSSKIIEVEVESLLELEEALAHQVDIIMLDNFDLEQMREAVIMNAGRAKLEVSGNVTLDNLAQIAATGVDYISVGALTKHVRSIDLSMRLEEI